MGILLKSKAAPAAEETTKKATGKKSSLLPGKTIEPESTKKDAAPSGGSWFKRGNQTAGALEKEDQRIEEKKSEMGKLFRFWLNDGESGRITFVDGELTSKGVLDCFMFREHQIFRNGKWTNWYTCTSDQEPCPICESGDDPSLVGILTIIDHREYKGKKATYKDTKKLFVAKRGTIKILQQLAAKRGGLTGCTFEVSRNGDGSPNVGNVFDFEEKNTVADLRKHFVQKNEKTKKVETYFTPAAYEEEITYRTAEELRELGFGNGTPVGGEKPLKDATKASKSVEDEMG